MVRPARDDEPMTPAGTVAPACGCAAGDRTSSRSPLAIILSEKPSSVAISSPEPGTPSFR